MGHYDAAGKRRSSATHARQPHTCEFCGRVAFGNGGNVAHQRTHVRSGEAVELEKWYATESAPGRVFVPVGDAERRAKFEALGFSLVEPGGKA